MLASGEAAETLLADGPLDRDEDRETGMGNLITDAFQVKTGGRHRAHQRRRHPLRAPTGTDHVRISSLAQKSITETSANL